ncbi:MAG: hypothetical protein Q9208_001949 [Pyrenodesmia sp. 3 TL-2023]
MLAVANQDLPFTAFSSSNIASVYDSLAQRFYADEEAGDPNRLQLKQAVEKFKAELDPFSIHAVLRSVLSDLPDYMAYCHATSKTLKDSEIARWVLREMLMAMDEDPIGRDRHGQMVAYGSGAAHLPVRDLGSLEEVVKTQSKILAQTYNATTALQEKTLLVKLPKEYRVGASDPPSHLHTFNQLLPGEICITPKRELPQDDDMPQPTIALEFLDRPTKELARVCLAKVLWQKGGHPPAALMVTDYPRHGKTDETCNVIWTVQIIGPMFVKDLALLILNYLPQAGRYAVYEVSPIRSRLNGVHVARLRLERSPEWVARWASAPSPPGPFYICAYPLQLCQHCPSRDDRLPELSDADITLDYVDGLNPKMIINSDRNFASFVAENEVPESILEMPATPTYTDDNRSTDHFFMDFVGEYIKIVPNRMFRFYQKRILECLRDRSADDMIAVYRSANWAHFASCELLFEVWAGQFARRAYAEEENAQPRLEGSNQYAL